MAEMTVIALIVAAGVYVVARFAVRSISASPKCSTCEACRLASSCDHPHSSNIEHPPPVSNPAAPQK